MKKSILDILEFKDKDIDTEKLLNYKGFRSHEKNKLGNFCIFVCSDGDADIGDSYIKKIHNEFQAFRQELEDALSLYPPKNNDEYNTFKDIQSAILDILNSKNIDRNGRNGKINATKSEKLNFCIAVYCMFARVRFNPNNNAEKGECGLTCTNPKTNNCIDSDKDKCIFNFNNNDFIDNDFIQDYIDNL